MKELEKKLRTREYASVTMILVQEPEEIASLRHSLLRLTAFRSRNLYKHHVPKKLNFSTLPSPN